MTQPPPIQASRVSCVSCGYNLTGVTIGGECPECGMAIETSIQGRLSAPTSKAALWSMVIGIVSLAFCSALGPISIVLYFKAKKDLQAGLCSTSSSGMATAGLVLGIISTVLTVGLAMLFAFGMWRNF